MVPATLVAQVMNGSTRIGQTRDALFTSGLSHQTPDELVQAKFEELILNALAAGVLDGR